MESTLTTALYFKFCKLKHIPAKQRCTIQWEGLVPSHTGQSQQAQGLHASQEAVRVAPPPPLTSWGLAAATGGQEEWSPPAAQTLPAPQDPNQQALTSVWGSPLPQLQPAGAAPVSCPAFCCARNSGG